MTTVTNVDGSNFGPNISTSGTAQDRSAGICSYSPNTGSIDPGNGIPGFNIGTGRLKVTLAGNTTFAGLPAGADGQFLILVVVAGNFTLTLTAAGNTAGAAILASNSVNLILSDALPLMFDGPLNQWIAIT